MLPTFPWIATVGFTSFAMTKWMQPIFIYDEHEKMDEDEDFLKY